MNKLQKFAAMAEMPNVIQCTRENLLAGAFSLKGSWGSDFFHNNNPIVLELGCGKGEYAVEMAAANPDKNFIGIDIKGARMFTGADRALKENIPNVAFLRTEIELIEYFFAPEEVAGFWITFPDPQMKKVNKRLTSARFLKSYARISAPETPVNLKTDSPFLSEFTRRIVAENRFSLLYDTDDLYGLDIEVPAGVREIKTAYEKQWLARGKKINFLKFILPSTDAEIINPDDSDIEKDDYRAMPRFNG